MQMPHVDAVAQLEKQCFSLPWSVQSIESELYNPLSVWLVAVEDGQVVGYVGSQAVIDEADMMNIAVLPEYRGHGIAAALIGALTDTLRERGVTALSLEVRASNLAAISLYRKLGFTQVGRRKNYYEKPKEDAEIYRKEWCN